MSQLDTDQSLTSPHKRTHSQLKNDTLFSNEPHTKHTDLHSGTTIASETDLMSNTHIM